MEQSSSANNSLGSAGDNGHRPGRSFLRRNTGVALALWTLLTVASLAWNLVMEERHLENLLEDKARTHIQKDQSLRLWASRHGGIYVPTDERTPPSSYLSDLPEREVVTPSGQRLILMPPAYIMRQLNEESATGTIRGHMTSLKLMRPQNAPDAWERKALHKLKGGQAEVAEFSRIGGETWLRLMRPLYVEESCLKCHAHQGYEPGDLRGGISASVSTAPYRALAAGQRQALVLSHGVIWLLGAGGIGFVLQRASRRERERRQAEKARRKDERVLRRLNRTLKMLSACNQALIQPADEATLLRGICRDIVEIGGYRLAWVGFAEHDEEKSVRPVAQDGFEEGYLETLRITWKDNGRGRGPTGTAIRSGTPAVAKDILSDPVFAPWRGEALKRGYASSIALPLLQQGEAFGALNIYAEEPDVFDAEEIEILKELADDMAYGIQARRIEEEKRQAQEMLRLRNRAIEASINGVMISEAGETDRPLIYVNAAFEKITGYDAEEVLGSDPRFLAGGDRNQKALVDIRAAMRERRAAEALVRNYRRDGSLFWSELSVAPVRDEDGRTTHFVSIINDVSDRKRYEEELERRSNFDELTGLANRNLLADRLSQALAHARCNEKRLALFLLDLDRFQIINDSLGHSQGNELLKRVAERLQKCVRAQDTLARFGGDEFVLMLTELEQDDRLYGVAQKIKEALAPPFTIGSRSLQLTASIGISVYPENGEDEETLIRQADIAMYQAKEYERGTCRLFSPEMDTRVVETMGLESDLRRALEHGELLLHFQPKIDVAEGGIVGSEALVRWQHPKRGMISPGSFIPLAEETGLIAPLGAWVMAEACRANRAFQKQGLAPVSVAVNVSARQFRSADLVDLVKEALEESALEPRWLQLELTESAVMDYPEEAIGVMRELNEIGVGLSLDDFGTGYSSLNYLRRFPVDDLKIDRSFINDVVSDNGAASVARSIIGIAHSLGIKAIAEGVETPEQLAFLRACRCDTYQGFLFSRPLPAEDFLELLV